MFIAIAKVLKRHNAKMVLFAAQSPVREVFASAGLDEIVSIVAGEAEALSLVAS